MKPQRKTDKSNQHPIRRIFRRLTVTLVLSVAALVVLSLTSSRPANLGVTNGQFAKCPDTPNCVSTQATEESHRMPTIPMVGNNDEIVAKIKSVIESEFPRTRLVGEMDNYLHFEFTSLLFRFVDDVEFLVDDKQSLVGFRSASRVGYSDLGTNRKRMKRITDRLIK